MEVEATATLMEGLMEDVVLVAAAVLVAAVVSEEVPAQLSAVAADTEEVSDGAVRIRPREHGMEHPTTGLYTR